VDGARPSSGPIRFGTFEVDPNAGELRKQGVRIKLQDQPLQILRVLLERPGEVVTREQLQQRVWPADTFVDFDHGLYNAIKRLREALGDIAEAPRFIETIPRRGYRFIGVVNGNGNAPIGSAEIAPPLDNPSISRRSLRLGIAIGAVGIVMLLAVIALMPTDSWRIRWFNGSVPEIRSVAVLPLQNLSGDSSQDYFADGMTEELITELSQVSALKVISRTSVMRYKGSSRPLPQIARELGVECIITGSVLRSGNRVRTTAQLIYAPQDKNIWAQSYERDIQDVLALQSTVASAIVEGIRVKMTPGEQAQLSSHRPVNLKAHEAYLQGRYHLQLEEQATFKKDKAKVMDLEAAKAETYFREAIKEDPDYAPSYLGIFEAWQSTALPNRDWQERARPLLLKALQLDDSLAEAHRAMASIRFRVEWNWPGAEKEYQRAIQLAPSNADTHDEYATLLAETARTQEAVREFELAQSLDPQNDHMAAAFYWTRQFDRAITLYQSQAQLRPSDFFPHYQLANIYAVLGKNDEAISEWQKMATVLEYNEMAADIGHAYRTGGYNQALRVFSKEIEASSKKASFVPSWFIASIYGFMGDKDRAFAWLEKAYEVRDGVDSLYDPSWDPLRSDPRFKDLMRRVGLPQ
jgi:TolB-like protein/DNA-binding winged helix-turn-helix (wHTH) protein